MRGRSDERWSSRRRLWLTLLVGGVLFSTGCGATFAWGALGAVSAPSFEIPATFEVDLRAGTNVMFLRVASVGGGSVGPVTVTTTSGVEATLRVEDIRITDPGGAALDVVPMGSVSETINRDSSVYRGVLRFDVARRGRHRVEIVPPSQGRLVITRSIASLFRRWPLIVGSGLGGLTALTATVMLLIGRSRRVLTAANPVPWAAAAPPGWYAGPKGWQQWDGSQWVDPPPTPPRPTVPRSTGGIQAVEGDEPPDMSSISTGTDPERP